MPNRHSQEPDAAAMRERVRTTVRDPPGLILALHRHVIWFYERRGEHLRCEVRQMIEGDKYALIVMMPDGTERTELFDDGGSLNRRWMELEQMLTTKGWNGPYARDI